MRLLKSKRSVFLCVLFMFLVALFAIGGKDSYAATAAGTVVQMTNHGSGNNCYQGDWINNALVVYHCRDNDAIYKTDGVMDTQLTNLLGEYYCDSHPDVNDTGSLIVFQRNVDSPCAGIWVMDTNGGNQTQIVSCDPNVGGAQAPKWSPDGKYIAYTQGFEDHNSLSELYAVGSSGGTPTRLTFGYNQPEHDGGISWVGSWSGGVAGSGSPRTTTTGQVLVSLEDTATWWADPDSHNHISTPGPRGVALVSLSGVTTWLTNTQDEVCENQQLPTSTGRIVYKSDITNTTGDIYSMDRNGLNKKQLTTTALANHCSNHPTPHPSGKYIAYWSDFDDGTWRIWMMTADGNYKAVVADETAVNNAYYWRPLKFNAAGTKLLFTGCSEGACTTENIFSLNLDTADTDGDGLKNWEEVIYGTNPAVDNVRRSPRNP